MRRLLALAVLVAISISPARAAEPVFPTTAPDIVALGKPAAPVAYTQLPAAGLVFRLEGPGTLSGFVKTHYAPGEKDTRAGVLNLAGIDGLPAALPFELRYSRRGEYADGRKGSPSRGETISLDIPAGRHELMVSGEVAGGGLLLALYYDGPPQWDTQVVAMPKPKEPGAWKKQLGFTWRSSAALTFTYDDNAYKMSEEYLREYRERRYWNEEKFQKVDREDDLILKPRLELQGRRKGILPGGQTRLTLRYSRNQYIYNTALNNHEFRVSLRQAAGRGRSWEVYYNYSPSKYLRQLNDRPPLTSDNTPVVSEQFRLERNQIVGVWRQRLHKRVSGTFTFTKKLYYYNKPHLENDINSWGGDAAFVLTLLKPLKLKLHYGYEDALSRAIDVEGQELETSPASDGSYKQNKYNAELTWNWPWSAAKLVSKQIRVRAQYRVAYFSALGTEIIDDDPYHVGRQDNVYTYQIKGGRALPALFKDFGLPEAVSMDFGFSYDERDVDSPWAGDIKEDKNWISRTYWVGFRTRLF